MDGLTARRSVLSVKTQFFGLTVTARVGLIAILYLASNNYLEIEGGGFGETLNKGN